MDSPSSVTAAAAGTLDVIRHIGLCNATEEQLRAAQRLTPIVSLQNRYNVADRTSESLVDLCESETLVFMPWAPIQQADGLSVVQSIAHRHGATLRQVVLAWLVARSPLMLPIAGTGTVAHLEENVASVGLALSAEEVSELTQAN